LRLVNGCTINVMVHRILGVIVAVLGVMSPGKASAGGTPAELVQEVTQLHTAGKFSEAARLADAAARREDMGAVYRVLLGGLARQNYEMSFDAGGPATDLCKAVEILRIVAPLDTPQGGASKIKAAEDAETRLERELGSTWRSTCTPGVPVALKERVGVGETAAAPKPEAPPSPVTHPPPPVGERGERRRVRVGVGTLVPGLVMFAPMAGLLAYRAAGERELLAHDAETMTRPRTDADDRKAAALNQRYTASTAGAIALGVMGAALVVTGAVLLATGARERRMSVTPWGARGVGGLVLEGRF